MAQSSYGTVYTAREIANQLRETDRNLEGALTWQSAEQSALMGLQKQESALSQSYREATSAAYDAYLKNKRAITSSDLIGESKEQLLSESQQTLSEAYSAYQSSYLEGQEAIAENYMQQISSIDNALMTQAEMTQKYGNYHGDYYDFLIENYGSELLKNPYWAEAMTVNITDEKGEPTEEKRLATWNELKTRMYDEDGYLTLFGVNTMDLLENAEIGAGIETWGEFLSGKDADVYDWAVSYNPYNFTVGGSNAATFRAMTGRLSTDDEYSFLERFGGLDSEQVDSLFSTFNDSLKKLESYSSEKLKNKGKKVVGKVQNVVDELNKFTADLGIDKEINEMLDNAGIKNGLQGLADSLVTLKSQTKNEGKMTGEWFHYTFDPLKTIPDAFKSFKDSPSKYDGSFGPGLIEGFSKLIAPWAYASANVNADREENKRLAKNAIEGYRQVLNNIIMYSHQKQQEAQQRFVSGIL